ncbi:MAG TPA: excinuclease ABC subunit UvrC [Blastocatellia bacterium]|nr:excinuclease ABC subunit UvrC [Blastocatellia bacterium]HMV85798.1 excinuclease ABC subunit UvrC [Blastocatellia bacterium]HMY73441.1 excinuclease ABC subunit UvrC [Blastocatellia bacterium]HMZ19404.1 excinuclease ABC subunit UvrC [Blastocatellia bacterium]HNG31089.1 excinuclease ABC subunit UvrC [Blastocatellia bacterium]
MTLDEKLNHLPTQPGVYIHKNVKGQIIYIGKAKSLRNRVRQYFQSSRAMDAKTQELVARIADLEYIVTDTEVEALVLESNLIKQHKPRYNVMLKDDKSYPHLKLTVNEELPRIFKTRQVEKDGAAYFGPYLPASLADKTVRLINREFQLRTCSDEVFEIYKRAGRPCMEYQIKRCAGPCQKDLCKPEHYREMVGDVRLLLEGRDKELADNLEARMLKASEEMRFEQAAKYRDLMRTVRALSENQKMMGDTELDVDIFGYHRDANQLALQLFTMREGRIIGRREFYWEDIPVEGFNPSEFLGEVLEQYYTIGNYIPLEIHVPVDWPDRDLLEQALTEKRGRRVRILDPQRGSKREMIDLVEKNAKIGFDQRFRVIKPDWSKVLVELQELLSLPNVPHRIESFDISNIQGSDNVAGMVVCEEGEMKKADYRKFIIKSVEGADDFASMREAVYRRYSRLLKEEKQLPDLIFIDGGKGQLSSAATALHALGLGELPVAGIVKPRGKHEEISHLLVKGREDEPVFLEKTSLVMRLVRIIRDETHRYAVSYHRQRRAMRDFQSELTSIPGVGEKLKERLLRNFGSLKRVGEAGIEELRPFVGQKQAERILEHFRQRREADESETAADNMSAVPDN